MPSTQISGVIERAATVLVMLLMGWMVRKGWLGNSDAATLAPAIILLPSLAYGAWINREKGLVQAAAAIPGTVIVTTPALAAATPENNNIVSSTETKVTTR